MSGVIDTNLLLYAANYDCPEHSKAKAFVSEARCSSSSFLLTEGICYEFLRVTTHPKVFSRPLRAVEALSYLNLLMKGRGIHLLSSREDHWAWLGKLLDEVHHPAGNLFFDLRTAALMRENGVRTIYTADTDFLQFPGIDVVNPLK
jgi:uncharacterized protein